MVAVFEYNAPVVTLVDAILCDSHCPLFVALAVITVPAGIFNPVMVHVPPVTVVVPNKVPVPVPWYKLIVVPFVSLEVPLTEVIVPHKGEFIAGAVLIPPETVITAL
jgi:hypothetical protein